MSNHKAILDSHAQHYQKSCAASGMELVLKLHSFVDAQFRDFQDKYGNTNIGFEKLADMANFGITAQDHETPIEDGLSRIQDEIQRGHYPILSMYSDRVGWHIWVAVPDGDSFRLLSRAYGYDETLEIDDLDVLRQNLTKFRGGKIHFVTYDLSEPDGK